MLLERTEDPARLEGLSLSDLDGSDDDASGSGYYDPDHDVPLSERNVAGAVLAGCKARLLSAYYHTYYHTYSHTYFHTLYHS